MAPINIKTGQVQWVDLTIENAEKIRDFYQAVIGWKPEPVDMDGYEDFNMCAPDEQAPVAGICHARGANRHLPPHWLIYIAVFDLDQSVDLCCKLGGKIISEPTEMGPHGRFCVIQDPAGAFAALFQPAQP